MISHSSPLEFLVAGILQHLDIEDTHLNDCLKNCNAYLAGRQGLQGTPHFSVKKCLGNYTYTISIWLYINNLHNNIMCKYMRLNKRPYWPRMPFCNTSGFSQKLACTSSSWRIEFCAGPSMHEVHLGKGT